MTSTYAITPNVNIEMLDTIMKIDPFEKLNGETEGKEDSEDNSK